ncbi:MAG: hypothetical protein HYX90_09915 [Chloroflexi bacterium]|nr:hypothetical protein [Chloroflexota bacterium]
MTTRPFDDKDRAKKSRRISASAIELPAEVADGVREAVRLALRDGYLSCPSSFGIAKRLNVPLAAVGDAADALGIRVVDCQLGCFKVDKAVHDTKATKVSPAAAEAVGRLGTLTCQQAFALAKQLRVRPLDIADAANARHLKVRDCRLGCF